MCFLIDGLQLCGGDHFIIDDATGSWPPEADEPFRHPASGKCARGLLAAALGLSTNTARLNHHGGDHQARVGFSLRGGFTPLFGGRDVFGG